MEKNSPMKIIKSELKKMEKENHIKILFAVETGSRLWRFESKDSDYDIRFVYIRQTKEYLKLHKPADVIMKQIDDKDFVGFDIYKFCNLLMNSNPSIIEWLQSDLIYFDDGITKKKLWEIAQKNYNPLALVNHYKSMGKQNYLKYLKSGDLTTEKKYLYSLRGICVAKWVENKRTIAPVIFESLLKEQDFLPEALVKRMKIMIENKKMAKEKERIQNIKIFDEFIENALKTESHQELNRKFAGRLELEEFVMSLHELNKLE